MRLFCLFVFHFGSAGSLLPLRSSLLWHWGFSSCSMWNLSSLIRDRTQASCIGSAESYPLDHQGSLLQIRSVIVITLIMVLVILTRGIIYNTINTKNITVTVWQWPMRLASTSSYYQNLTCEVGQTLKSHTKICWLAGQYGPTEPNCPRVFVSWPRRGLCASQYVKLLSCQCKCPAWRKCTQATEKSNPADQDQCHLVNKRRAGETGPPQGHLVATFPGLLNNCCSPTDIWATHILNRLASFVSKG